MSPFKGQTGIKRIFNAGGYSLDGLRAAFTGEAAFRQLVLLNVILIPLSFFLTVSRVERALLIAVCLLALIVELLNSAVEAAMDFPGSPPAVEKRQGHGQRRAIRGADHDHRGVGSHPDLGDIRQHDLVTALHPGGKGAAQLEEFAHGRGLVLLFMPDKVELPGQVQVRGLHRHQAAAPERIP